jgi:N-acetylglucosamine-6-sulfatase
MRSRNLSVALLLLLLLAGAVASLGGSASRAAATPPNIVLVLTDDLSWNLVRYMPHVRQMRQRGVTFSRYFVTDSLCCPSRASIFTGRFPHNTKIFTNMAPDGGFQVFRNRGEERSTFATALKASGYRTAMMGKYLNGYRPANPVPPGWTEWDVAGNGYRNFNYRLSENGRRVGYGNKPSDYLTDVIARKGSAFIQSSASANQPFVLELATFAPHAPYTPAPRDAGDFPGLKAPRGPAFNAENTRAPRWLRNKQPLTAAQISNIDTAFRKRAQAVQAVDDLIARIESTLNALGIADNTYVLFTSDNGYHMGEHQLTPGKQTAFETDIRVPLIAIGPGVPSGKTIRSAAENIDLRPTFSRLARAHLPRSVDGHSLVSLLHGKRPKRWRRAALIEHHGPDLDARDPDRPARGSGNPTTYEALRTKNAVYVEYRGGEREYYNLRRDPNQLHNTYRKLSKRRRAQLHRALARLKRCRGAKKCR